MFKKLKRLPNDQFLISKQPGNHSQKQNIRILLLLPSYSSKKILNIKRNMNLRPGNTGNIFLQLAKQHCCVACWKAFLHVLPPTSNIVTATEFRCCKLKKICRNKVDANSTCCFNLQQQNFVAWQCLRWVQVYSKEISILHTSDS